MKELLKKVRACVNPFSLTDEGKFVAHCFETSKELIDYALKNGDYEDEIFLTERWCSVCDMAEIIEQIGNATQQSNIRKLHKYWNLLIKLYPSLVAIINITKTDEEVSKDIQKIKSIN